MKALCRLAWLAWLARASNDASHASARAQLRKIAVGVNTGGPRAAERIDAARASFLRYFSRVLVMGDVARAARASIRRRGGYCARDSDWGAARSPAARRSTGRASGDRAAGARSCASCTSRSRCASWPGAPTSCCSTTTCGSTRRASARCSSAARGGGDGLARRRLRPGRAVADGPEPLRDRRQCCASARRRQAYSRALATALGPRALVRCASQFEFACSVRGCCDHGAAVCATRARGARAVSRVRPRARAACAARGSDARVPRVRARAARARRRARRGVRDSTRHAARAWTPMYYGSER